MTEKDIELIDEYEIIKGLVNVVIVRDRTTGLYLYNVIEPTLSDNASKVLMKSRELLRMSDKLPEGNNVEVYLRALINETMSKLRIKLGDDEIRNVMYYLVRDTAGYGKIDPLIRDDYTEDVNINGPNKPVYVWHSRYEHLRTNITLSNDELNSLVVKISQRVGKNVSSAYPILEGLLPEGLRVELGLKDISPYGSIITIRKFRANPITVIDLIIDGVIKADAAATLWFMLENGINMVIIGPTGAGKTTLLNALLFLIRPEARIVTIEDTREINIPHEQWVPLVIRESETPGVRNVTAYELVKVSMRIRPDYLVVGELRGEEAYVFFQGLASGHTGLTTIHASSLNAAVRRLLSRPMNVPPALIPLANVFILINRVKVSGRIARRVIDISELLDVSRDGLRVNTLFRWSKDKDDIIKLSDSALIADLIRMGKVLQEEVDGELKRRTEVMVAMAKYGFRSPEAVFRVTRNYYVDPERTHKTVISGELP
ncbi:type II secretion system protein E [Vulcanisaeta moutnovskia 768-28]|uniref:Type II secretion system protein E n=1 Tax=Vulcanisaeta moutnovskia (strain 768-28) TaxID=985053 RepID=F0QW59_VULM7|nr:type II/IV secretion system ATPase subunit [Vulcanisaeta moutnovskia]ADY02154.1 type II secretion system protein E [Vulcanisaeta moutnovskia 768-28]